MHFALSKGSNANRKTKLTPAGWNGQQKSKQLYAIKAHSGGNASRTGKSNIGAEISLCLGIRG